MNKETFLKIYLFMLMLVFCSYFSSVALAGVCDELGKSGGVQTFPGNFNVPPDWRAPESPVQWAPGNQEVINRNGSLVVSVIDGAHPYNWSVSGTGFSLEHDETEGLSNTLNADDTACGAAEITVTDNDGSSETSAKGYVREEGSGASKWYEIPIIVPCPIPGPAMEIDGWNNMTRTQGKYRIFQSYASCTSFPSTKAETCEEANNHPWCGSQFPEGQCIDLESTCKNKGRVLFGEWCCTYNEEGTGGTNYLVKTPYYHIYEWGCRP